MKRIITLITVLAMMLSSLVGITSFAEGDALDGSVSIKSANLEFGSNVYLLIAVDYSAAYSNAAAAKAAVYITVDGEKLLPDDSVEKEVGVPEGCIAFKYTKLGAQNMGDVLEIKAYNGEALEDSTTYSILEYIVKAKATKSDDQALMLVLSKLQSFGAAAQKVFNHTGDYALADENGNINYGLVLVGGSSTAKTIAKVGSTLTPVADGTIFTKSDVKLYNLTFDVVENGTLTVAEGVSRYFFYGSDLWGAEGSYNSANGDTKSPNAGCMLDLDLYTGSHTKYLVSGTNTTKNGYKYSLRLDKYLETGAIEALTKSGINYGASSATSQRPWSLETPSAEHLANLADGYREIDKGWLYLNAIDDPATADKQAPTIVLGASKTTVAKNFVVDGEFTVTVSIAKKAGEAYSSSPLTLYGGTATSASILNFCHVNGTDVMMGDVKIGTLNEYTGAAPEEDDFLVIHFVVNVNDNSVSVYTDAGFECKATASLTDADSVSAVVGKSGWLRWAAKDGAICINRLGISEGNIFN